jgi:hypothetical protein
MNQGSEWSVLSTYINIKTGKPTKTHVTPCRSMYNKRAENYNPLNNSPWPTEIIIC